MKKITVLSAAVLLIAGLCSSTTLAGGPMGPPKALLGRSQWAVDAEYFHEEIDLRTDGLCRGWIEEWSDPEHDTWKIKNLKTNMFFGSLGYGIHDNWDIFVRVGIADAQDEIATGAELDEGIPEKGIYASYRLDGSYGFAWGVGTRVSLYESGPWTLGGLCQVAVANPGSSTISRTLEDLDLVESGTTEIDFWQVQVAIGATCQLGSFSIYGGPFLQWIRGDLDLKSTWRFDGEPEPVLRINCSHDIKEESKAGGFVGALWDVKGKGSLYAEAQYTSDSYGIGIGGIVPIP